MASDGMLLCEAHVKRYILETAKRVRPGWRVTRVSQAAIEQINAQLRDRLMEQIKSHPTVGQTFKL